MSILFDQAPEETGVQREGMMRGSFGMLLSRSQVKLDFTQASEEEKDDNDTAGAVGRREARNMQVTQDIKYISR